MNLCKRACLYSIRKKGKAFTLLIFLLVMATLMLTCLSIQSATETANANIKKALLGYFTINAKTLENGIPEAELARIHAPIGLDILGQTPAEIAVSITAEMILHRAKRSGTAKKPREEG